MTQDGWVVRSSRYARRNALIKSIEFGFVPSASLSTSAIPPKRTAPVPLYQPQPVIRESAAGVVETSFTILPDGSVSDVQVVKGISPQTDTLVVNAIKTWKFKPATLDGQPVSAPTKVSTQIGRR